MRMGKRIQLLPALIVALAASLTGCYTVLKHPEIETDYDYEGEELVYIHDHCGECHDAYPPPYPPPLPPPPHRRDESDREPVATRAIDPATPIRPSVLGSAPPAGSGTPPASGESESGESKQTGTDTVKKKNPPSETTPVKRTAEEKEKSSDENKKTKDPKKEKS